MWLSGRHLARQQQQQPCAGDMQVCPLHLVGIDSMLSLDGESSSDYGVECSLSKPVPVSARRLVIVTGTVAVTVTVGTLVEFYLLPMYSAVGFQSPLH